MVALLVLGASNGGATSSDSIDEHSTRIKKNAPEYLLARNYVKCHKSDKCHMTR